MDTAVLSIISLGIGAALQYFFTKHIENQRHIRELRAKAYMDFLKSVCEYGNFGYKPDSKEGIELAERTAHAKSRICLYGSTKVIQAFSQWQQVGPSMVTDEQRSAFISLVKAMRADSGGEVEVNSVDLKKVLLGAK